MSFQLLANLTKFNAANYGAADLVVASAYGAGYVTPEQAVVINGKVYTYYAQSLDGSQFEQGTGAYNTTTHTQSRTTVLFSSNSDNSKVNFTSAPVVDVFPSASVGLESVLISNNTFTGTQDFTNTTPSTSPTTGSIVVGGGVGISGAINAGGAIDTGGVIVSSGGFQFPVSPSASGKMTINTVGQTGINLANGGNAIWLPGGPQFCWVFIQEISTSGDMALYAIQYTGVFLIWGTGQWSVPPTTTPAAGYVSLAFDGTNHRIYNNLVGGQRTFNFTTIRN